MSEFLSFHDMPAVSVAWWFIVLLALTRAEAEDNDRATAP